MIDKFDLFVAGPIARLPIKQMYFVIESRLAWDSSKPISSSLIEELKFGF